MIIVNPTLEQVQQLIDVAHARNKGQRQRLCYFPKDFAERIMSTKAGLYKSSGGAVPNSYQWSAYSTYLYAAWYTNRGKHVLIQGRRDYAQRRSYGQGTATVNLDSAGWSDVYYERASKLKDAKVERARKAIQRVGPEGQDDRLQVWRPIVVEYGKNGLLVADERGRQTQVVVRDSTTGQRHHITVPPRFGNPKSKTYQKNRGNLVQAAIAWTFNMKPEEYQPQMET